MNKSDQSPNRKALLFTVGRTKKEQHLTHVLGEEAIQNDGKLMQRILLEAGFQKSDCESFKDEKATRGVFSNQLRTQAASLGAGDLLVVYFSGHGIPLEDLDSATGEPNEAMCFYDSNFTDNMMCDHLAKFKEGVRILMIADCCFSGEMVRTRMASFYRHYFQCENDQSVKASVILLGASDYNEVAWSNGESGLFTSLLYECWQEWYKAGLRQGYKNLAHDISQKLTISQDPQIRSLGSLNENFMNGIIFS